MRNSASLRYVIEDMIEVPEIFTFVQEQTQTIPQEMIKIFNYGLGFVIFIDGEEDAQKVVALANESGFKAIIGGYVEEADQREVQVNPLNTTLTSENFLLEQ